MRARRLAHHTRYEIPPDADGPALLLPLAFEVECSSLSVSDLRTMHSSPHTLAAPHCHLRNAHATPSPPDGMGHTPGPCKRACGAGGHVGAGPQRKGTQPAFTRALPPDPACAATHPIAWQTPSHNTYPATSAAGHMPAYLATCLPGQLGCLSGQLGCLPGHMAMSKRDGCREPLKSCTCK